MSKQVSLEPKIRRAALASLTRERLSGLSEHFALEVSDRRVLDQHVDALVRSRAVNFAEVLGMLKREELQGICDALELERSGKEKDVLVDRILGGHEAAPATKATAKNGAAPTELELPATGKLTVDQLERHLWSAADILRGSIDSSDYKGFIFGLLFLKRLSDVFEEEAEKLVAAGELEKVAWSDEDQHQFFVPTRARWSELQKVSTGIGEALNKACAALEEKNESLEGLLAQIDYNDERRLGDAKNRDTVLSKLVLHFSKVNLRNSSLSEPDMLGRAYEYLIEKFADDAGKKGGEFYTPRKVVQLIVELLAPKEGMRICDPTCGSGGMLVECAHYVRKHGGNAKNLTYHGQEKNLGTWAIAKMNLLLHGLTDARIEKGDTIRDPKLVKDGGLILYDRVVANPPFSLDEWGVEVAEHDGFGRFHYGIPPKTKGDLAFVQHMVATLNATGQLGVVMPHGVLFRGGSEAEIRKGLVSDDLVDAVIGLPPNLFYGTTIEATLLLLSRAKPPERRRKILFIDASRDVSKGKTQNFLREEDVKRIAETAQSFRSVPRYSRVVPAEEVEANGFNLIIGRYVSTAEAEQSIDFGRAVEELAALEAERTAALTKMAVHLKALGYGK
jgi:type I restriction enzyme M protein